MNPLSCTHRHPAELVLDRHHIQPQAWGGPTTDENLADVCPNVHRLSHTLLNRYKGEGTAPGWWYRRRFSTQVRALADLGWRRTVESQHPRMLELLPDL